MNPLGIITTNRAAGRGKVMIALAGAALTLLLAAGAIPPAHAAGDAKQPPMHDWSFAGPTGQFDVPAMRRGYRVYKEVCAACHGMRLLSFRNLAQPGGPEFTEAQAKAIAAEFTIEDGPNEDGDFFERPAVLTDRFPNPFPNDNAARAANGGALPPDLSVITNARTVSRGLPWSFFDLFTGYQEGGADYIYALLTGYSDAPPDMTMSAGMSYNQYFPGGQVAMSNPLTEGVVEFADGTPATVEQMSEDLVTFLVWAANPHQDARKRLGFQVMLYLLILGGVMYFANKRLWARIKRGELHGDE